MIYTCLRRALRKEGGSQHPVGATCESTGSYSCRVRDGGSSAQSSQSAKPFLKSLELGLPQPLTCRRVCPPPPVSWGRSTLAGEKRVGRVQIPTMGHTLWYSLYIRALWSSITGVVGMDRVRLGVHPPTSPSPRKAWKAREGVSGDLQSMCTLQSVGITRKCR
jgi:hypothetical protein